MEEKKIKALTDEELDKVAGGEESVCSKSLIPCPNCNGYTFFRPLTGAYSRTCHNCHATITFLNGKVQSIELPDHTPDHTPGEFEFEKYETPL